MAKASGVIPLGRGPARMKLEKQQNNNFLCTSTRQKREKYVATLRKFPLTGRELAAWADSS